jgi:hypothetical protein
LTVTKFYLTIMSETKTYVFGEQGQSSLNALLPFLQQRGIDPAYIQGLMNNGGGFFGNNAWEGIIALIVVAAIFGNGNGNGLFGGGNNSNNAEREMLMSAIQRNGTDLSQLAQTIGCSNGRLQDAIGEISTQLCNFAGQSGLSFQQVINSIQSGNASVIQSICDCCCRTQNSITTMGYENQLANCQQTNTLVTTANTNAQMLRDSATANTNAILGRIDAMERASLNDKIDALREKNAQQAVAINNYQQTHTFGAMITQATQPIASAVNNLQSDVDGIKCKLPKTETIIATPDYVPINRSINVGYAPYYCGGFNSFGGYGCGWNGNFCNGFNNAF